MLAANRAVRLGLRAASRNPELAFAKGLLDSFASLLALLPPAMAVIAFFAPLELSRILDIARGLSLAAAGGVLCAALLAFVGTMLFWTGAIPILAADVEVDHRPPSGNFALLAARGFARVLRAGAVAWALPLLFSSAVAPAVAFAVPFAFVRRSAAALAGAAMLLTAAIAGAILLDLLARLTVIRSAAFADGVAAAFGRAATLLAARLGGCLLISVAYFVLELVAASAAALFTGVISSSSFLAPRVEVVALPARAAVALAFAAVFAWLEVGKTASLAALALDAEGLVPPAVQPPPPELVAEPVVEALPVNDDPQLT